MSDELTQTPEPQWCLVANVRKFIRKGEGGREIVQGTKHFSGGTKVYCFPALWGDGYEQIQVIGKHRGTPKLVVMILDWRYLTNWRAMLVYEPRVLRLLSIGTRPVWACLTNVQPRELVERYVVAMRERESYLPQLDYLSGMEPGLPQLGAQLPGLGGDVLMNYLLILLQDEDRKVRSRVVRTMGNLKIIKAVPILIGLLDSEPVFYIQEQAAMALEQIATPEAANAAALWRERQRNGRV